MNCSFPEIVQICRPSHPSASLYEIVPVALVLPSMTATFTLSSATMANELLISGDPTDDVSVSTAMAENHVITSPNEVKEYAVKFLFRPDSSSNNTERAQTHYNILHCITHLYPEAQVFDNFGKTMKESPLLITFDAYFRHFKLQFVKANPHKKKQYHLFEIPPYSI